ncbi:MAG: DinB family protein [Lewinellaceae bacterium]|nr:DinB family protein [Lewinellaceae bacterium]MCB9290084.1 DinB family protein [Lewinellaceae bacterium]
MKRSEFLANRLKEVLLNGRWIANTNYKELITSVSWEQATRKAGSLNTIAALAYHINYYLAGLLNVFDGGALEIRDKYSFRLPPIRSQQDWHKLVDEFLANAEKFVEKVAQMPDEKFDEPFVDEKYGDYWRNIEGVIEHSYYHLGQISLIRKLVLENE